MAEKTLKQRIESVLFTNDAQVAFKLRDEVKAILQQNPDSPQSQDALERIYAQLSLIALMRLSDEEVYTMFEENPGYLMYAPETIDIIGNIKDHLRVDFFADDRNKVRDGIIEALQRSEDRLTEQKIVLGEEEVPPTVGNWVKEFVTQVGVNQPGRVAIARFLSQNPNVRKLSIREQAAVKRLIEVYSYLKLRSGTAAAEEDETLYRDLDDVSYQIVDGKRERLFTKEDLQFAKQQWKSGEISAFEFWKFLRHYPEDEIQNELREYEAAKGPAAIPTLSPQEVQNQSAAFFDEQMKTYGANILEVSEESSQTLINKLLQSLQAPGTIQQVQNTVYSLAQSPEMLARVLKNTQVIEFLDAQAQKRLDETNRAMFDQAKVSPVAFQLLLESLFEEKLRLSVDEAKWRAYEICRSLPHELREFKTVVSYDVRTNTLSYRYA